jgi:murein DD-endopeptidase MepM/ murein hydrolase activator NlpD
MTRSKISSSLAAVSLLALSACASRAPLYPVREPAAPAPLPPPPVQAPPPTPLPSPNENGATPAPAAPIQSAPLAPIGQQRSNTAPGPAQARPAPQAAASAQARATPAPPPALETPGQVTVGQNETLFDIAERVRTPVRAIIELNGLQPPYALAPGATLRIPPPLVYVVGSGDTLFGIARRFSIDPRSLANLNDFALETPIRPGQRIALPSLARDGGSNPQAGGASPTGMTVAAAAPARPAVRTASGAVTTAPAAAAAAAPAPMSDAAVAAAGKGRFNWPLKGEVISRFGPQGPGQRNDGLNIAAAPGSPVKAAASGEVVFAGQLPGFGNLVLLKHPGGWVTAYAHLSKLEVKMRDQVAQNQEVGQAGQTGQVDRPQLHFEVRYAPNPKDKARPVDPSLLLPG